MCSCTWIIALKPRIPYTVIMKNTCYSLNFYASLHSVSTIKENTYTSHEICYAVEHFLTHSQHSFLMFILHAGSVTHPTRSVTPGPLVPDWTSVDPNSSHARNIYDSIVRTPRSLGIIYHWYISLSTGRHNLHHRLVSTSKSSCMHHYNYTNVLANRHIRQSRSTCTVLLLFVACKPE